ncbi:MAG: hypothetical protein IPJ19_20435 [Planctomycetes bacterium]|nr:hypothetical protein [Planctomycetota bacterium]
MSPNVQESLLDEQASEQPPQPPQVPADAEASESVLAHLGKRLRYWSPVFALMLLFGEVAFLGLRPALAESRRLDQSEPAVAERLARAQESRATMELQLEARADPIYQERLRRLRQFPADGR